MKKILWDPTSGQDDDACVFFFDMITDFASLCTSEHAAVFGSVCTRALEADFDLPSHVALTTYDDQSLEKMTTYLAYSSSLPNRVTPQDNSPWYSHSFFVLLYPLDSQVLAPFQCSQGCPKGTWDVHVESTRCFSSVSISLGSLSSLLL